MQLTKKRHLTHVIFEVGIGDFERELVDYLNADYEVISTGYIRPAHNSSGVWWAIMHKVARVT